MAIHSGKKGTGLIGRPLSSRTYLSTNLQVADDYLYDPSVSRISDQKKGEALAWYPQVVSNAYDAIKNTTVNTPFYQGVYFQQEGVIVNQSFYMLDTISNTSYFVVDMFVTFNFKSTVEDVGILDPTTNVTVDNLAPLDTLYPYQEKVVQLKVDKDGSPTIDTQMYIKFYEDPNTYYMSITGLRAGQFYMSNPNWIEGVSIERRFLTSVFASDNMSETRKILRDIPVRTLQATLVFPNKYIAGRAITELRNSSGTTTAYPWYPDKSKMTQANTLTRVYCDVSYRRYQEGGVAYLVHNSKEDPASAAYETVRIDTLLSDGFTTGSDIAGTYVQGDSAYPAFICYASLEGGALNMLTSAVGTYQLEANEVYGSSALALENGSYVPEERASLPVFPLDINWGESVEVKYVSQGALDESGRGTMQYIKGDPYMQQTITSLSSSREECWDAIGFFNQMKGRGRPFWAKNAMDVFDILSTSSNTQVTVGTLISESDMEYFKYLWVTDSSGDFDIIEIIDATETVDGMEITLATNSLTDISTIKIAHIVRLSEDVVQEKYLTDGVMLSTFMVQELQGAY